LKVVFVGDNHCHSITPDKRKDDYAFASYEKFLECLNIAKNKEADAIVFLGDIFHKMDSGSLMVNYLLKALKNDENGEPWPFRKYVVIGNHDVSRRLEYLPKSSLGALVSCGFLEVQDVIEDLDIFCGHFTPELDEEIAAGHLVNKPYTICALHASIVNQKMMGHVIMFDDVQLSTKTQMVICGHIHKPMEQIRPDGSIFVNPGNVGRYAYSKDDHDREINILFVDYEIGKINSYEYIKLESVKPYDETFKLDEILENKDKKLEQRGYVQTISSIDAKSILWIGDNIDHLKKVAEVKKIDDIILNAAIDTVNEATEERLKKANK
jgi:DNA repair exonuclease SbcCD nuclease subunit